MVIIGLDISTSVIGYTVIRKNEKSLDLLEISHIEPNKKLNFWQKADFAIEKLSLIYSKYGNEIHETFIEEPVMGYSVGKSSANTIMTLAKFNYIISYYIRKLSNRDPTHITSAEARKKCGIKLFQRKKCGKSHKEQTLEYMIANDLKEINFATTKTSKYKNFVYDEVDSYVVAKAGALSK